jgi:hypothetical protein
MSDRYAETEVHSGNSAVLRVRKNGKKGRPINVSGGVVSDSKPTSRPNRNRSQLCTARF